MKKPILVLAVLFLIIGILLGTRTVVSARISTSGLELGEYQDESRQFRTQNAVLKEQIFKYSSLSYVFEIASKEGFVESKSTYAVSAIRPIALGQ